MGEHQLGGLWSYIAFEEGGVERSREQVAAMAKLVLLTEGGLAGRDGLWAAVSYRGEGAWPVEEVKAFCRRLILGGASEGDHAAPDAYLWAGGRFRVAPQRSPQEIDFEQLYEGVALGPVQPGLYRVCGEQLTLCLGEAGHPRPTGFSSRGAPHQSLALLLRGQAPGRTVVSRPRDER